MKAPNCLTLYQTIPHFTALGKYNLENIVGKVENASYQYFLLYQQCTISTLSTREIIILAAYELPSANALSLDQSKILLFGKESIKP